MRKIIFLSISFLLISLSAYAEQTIQIVGGVTSGNPSITIVNFNSDGNNSIAKIIYNDLDITGEFALKNVQTTDQVESNTLYTVVGTIESAGANKYKLNYQLTNNKNSANVLNQTITFTSNESRKAIHTISNAIYEKITTSKGAFNSKIAYISKNGRNYQLIVSDYDGYNPKTIVNSRSIISSIAWNQDGTQVAYASWEKDSKPTVWVQNINSGQRYMAANFSGSNSSPTFTPDGKQLLVTLTKDDGSHIYVINNQKYINNQTPSAELINYGTIDTEADIDTQGNVVFVSDHDGGPQIFVSNIKGTPPKRLTNGLGNYNTTPRYSPDGTKLTFINRIDGTLKAYILDIATQAAYPISQATNQDIAPSFAPNSKLILFSSDNKLYISNSTATQQTALNTIVSASIIDQRWSNNLE